MDDASAQLDLAHQLLADGQANRALEILRRTRPSDDLAYWSCRAWCHRLLGDWPAAEDAARRGLELAPDYPGLLVVYADAARERDDLAAAERALLAALRLVPDDPVVLARYAVVLASAGNTSKARRVLDRAESTSPADRAVIRARALVAFVDGDDRRSEADARRLVADDPQDDSAHFVLAVALCERRRYDGAAARFRSAAALDPGDADYVEAARELRYLRHPLLVPLRPIQRFGLAGSWFALVMGFLAAQLTGLWPVALVIAAVWLVVCVYSWIVPPALRAWLRRQGRL